MYARRAEGLEDNQLIKPVAEKLKAVASSGWSGGVCMSVVEE